MSSPAAGADWQLEGRGRRAWSPARPPRDLRGETPERVVTPESCGSGCACFPPYPELGSQVGCACEQELIPLLIPRLVVHTCFIHGWRLRRGARCASVLGPGKAGQGQSSPRSPDPQGLDWGGCGAPGRCGPTAAEARPWRPAHLADLCVGTAESLCRPPPTRRSWRGGVRGQPASLLLQAPWSFPHPCPASPCPPLAPPQAARSFPVIISVTP